MIILHIPHSSTVIPDKSGYLASSAGLDQEILRLTDWYTDELFSVTSTTTEIQKLVFPVSRIYCDVERFEDDNNEPMSKRGMGVCYTKTIDGGLLRKIGTKQRESILKDYYRLHHYRLTELVQNSLEIENRCLILDCHSFPAKALPSDMDQITNRPDICVGTDPFHTPRSLTEMIISFFQTQGFSVLENAPYKGTIVPLSFLQNNSKVESIMIEVNRKLYMDESTGMKSAGFKNTKRLLNQLIGSFATTVS